MAALMTTEAVWLIRGQVMHERIRPRRHRFSYPVFSVQLDLTRLDQINSRWFGVNVWRPLTIRLKDYGARDGTDPIRWVRTLLNSAGLPEPGQVYLHTFPRVFGFVFNPVSFWYCHDQSGDLMAVLAEVNNTFGETHRYLLCGNPLIDPDSILSADKLMHVSPFLPVEGQYQFRFRENARSHLVQIDYLDENGPLLHTAMGGRRQPLNNHAARNVCLSMPWMSLAIVAGIHYEALRLWRKGVKFYRKPAAPEKAITISTSTTSRNQS